MNVIDNISYVIEKIMELGFMVFYIFIVALILAENFKDCDNVDFEDIMSDTERLCFNKTCSDTEVFLLEENVSSEQFKDEMYIKDINADTIGRYYMISDGKDSKFRYAYLDKDENRYYTVGQIKKKSFIALTRYLFQRCDGTGASYEIREQLGANAGDYSLYRNKQLIGVSSTNIDFFCVPDITFVDPIDNTVLLVIARECETSFLRDKWLITNYNYDLIDNYVAGFMGYITTFLEEKD